MPSVIAALLGTQDCVNTGLGSEPLTSVWTQHWLLPCSGTVLRYCAQFTSADERCDSLA